MSISFQHSIEMAVILGTVLIVFAIGGTAILSIFGITVFSFMITGGVLLFMIAHHCASLNLGHKMKLLLIAFAS